MTESVGNPGGRDRISEPNFGLVHSSSLRFIDSSGLPPLFPCSPLSPENGQGPRFSRPCGQGSRSDPQGACGGGAAPGAAQGSPTTDPP